MSLISVDLPEPDTPVTQTKRPTGISTVTSLRLLPRAPTTRRLFAASRRWRRAGTAIDLRPERYCPVSEAGLRSISVGVPCATTSPPCSPAPGPMSTTWSAAWIASSSCSTTITELPRSRRRLSVSMSRALSRWCSPMEGSSSTYITPVRPEPIWLARRMRCASPPERVSAERVSER